MSLIVRNRPSSFHGYVTADGKVYTEDTIEIEDLQKILADNGCKAEGFQFSWENCGNYQCFI